MRRWFPFGFVAAACAIEPAADPVETSSPPAERKQAVASAPAPGGKLHRHRSLSFAGATYDFHFYEAAGGAVERPLVVVLHGGFAKIDAVIGHRVGAAPLGRAWLEIAEREGFHVLIPQAQSPRRGPHWNDCRADCKHCGKQDDVGFIKAMIKKVSGEVGVDPKRIYVSGESNGGYMTFRLAKEAPELFAAFGTVSALMPAKDDCAPAKAPANLVMIAGTADKAVVYAGGKAPLAASGSNLSAKATVDSWRARNQCEGKPVQRKHADRSTRDASSVTSFAHACSKTDTDLLLYKVDGGGHVPPSIDEQVSRAWERVAGQQNHDIETAEEHWRFFNAHSKK